jgi:hypothetical protein
MACEGSNRLHSHFDFAALQFGDWGAVVVSGSISRRSLLMPAHDSLEGERSQTCHVGWRAWLSQREGCEMCQRVSHRVLRNIASAKMVLAEAP